MALGGDHRGEGQCDSDEAVEDLAVDVDVVPDQIRVQRGDERRDQAGGQRVDSTAKLENEQRCGDRNEHLRDADDGPRAAERPVERCQEEGIQRLGVAGRNAGNEAEGAAVCERPREPVALLRKRVEQPVAFIEQHDKAREDAGCDDDPRCSRARHAAARVAPAPSIHVRCQSSSTSRHQSRWPWSRRPATWSARSVSTASPRN